MVQRVGMYRCLSFSFPFLGIIGFALVGLSIRFALALAFLHGMDSILPVLLLVMQTPLALGLGKTMK